MSQIDFEIKRYNEAMGDADKLIGDEKERVKTILEYIRREILAIDGMIERGQTNKLHERYDKINAFHNQIKNGKEKRR